MNIIVHKPKKVDDGSIDFPGLHCWNPETEVATIAAQVSGNRVSCRVSIADLKTKFHELSETPMETVKKYRKEIEDAARKLIENKAFEEDGSITIRCKDLA